MQKNIEVPFKIGKPVEDEYFINRETELRELIKQIKAMSNVCLLGLRRMGKTSILLKIVKRINDPIPIYVNCYGIPDKRRFASMLSDSIRDGYINYTGDGKYKAAIKRYLKESVGKIAYQLTDMDVSIGQYFRIRMGVKQKEIDPDIVLEDAFNYADRLGKSKGKRFLLMLDEFQDIGSRWGDDFLKRLRSIIEKQKNTCYIFSGSSITFMSSLVEDTQSPFYRQLYKIGVKSLPGKDVKRFVKRRFQLCNYKITDNVINEFIALTHSIPDYVQRLGLIASRILKNITKDVLEQAYEEMLIELDSEFREMLSKLNQRSGVYGAILSGLSKYDSLSDVGRFIGYDLSKAMRQITYLQKVGLIEKTRRGRYEISDPIFKDWLNNNFM